MLGFISTEHHLGQTATKRVVLFVPSSTAKQPKVCVIFYGAGFFRVLYWMLFSFNALATWLVLLHFPHYIRHKISIARFRIPILLLNFLFVVGHSMIPNALVSTCFIVQCSWLEDQRLAHPNNRVAQWFAHRKFRMSIVEKSSLLYKDVHKFLLPNQILLSLWSLNPRCPSAVMYRTVPLFQPQLRL